MYRLFSDRMLYPALHFETLDAMGSSVYIARGVGRVLPRNS